MEPTSRWVRAVELERLEREGRFAVEVSGVNGKALAVALFATAEGLFAIKDRCPHQYAPLSNGVLEGTVVRCALHGWAFDVRTGRPPVGRCPCVRSFPVRLRDGWVEIEVSGAHGGTRNP